MSQPEVLRLADALRDSVETDGEWSQEQVVAAAAELRRLAEMEDEWMALSQDQGKLEGQIDRLQARLAASEDQAERAVAGCERLRAQRDALLEALRELLADAEFLGWATAKARAAIKAVEENT